MKTNSRIVLQVVLAAECGTISIVVNSPDTDVPLLLVQHRQNVSAREIYIYNGKKFLPVHTLSTLLPKQYQAVTPLAFWQSSQVECIQTNV